ncbi:hypothetical protein GGE68_006465 [Rhizobium leguminosarum]|uniref:hypothetical protein n=1 Tax=Rhizobium leguminosarum TaxID=384 RepID=UPI0016132879|nr:hypothetical protein [Rhizobium leguminosarum]MBB5668210.1 hypothetical protein [Rhizobium leguminosarum]
MADLCIFLHWLQMDLCGFPHFLMGCQRAWKFLSNEINILIVNIKTGTVIAKEMATTAELLD